MISEQTSHIHADGGPTRTRSRRVDPLYIEAIRPKIRSPRRSILTGPGADRQARCFRPHAVIRATRRRASLRRRGGAATGGVLDPSAGAHPRPAGTAASRGPVASRRHDHTARPACCQPAQPTGTRRPNSAPPSRGSRGNPCHQAAAGGAPPLMILLRTHCVPGAGHAVHPKRLLSRNGPVSSSSKSGSSLSGARMAHSGHGRSPVRWAFS
jgi:hypothetical protein